MFLFKSGLSRFINKLSLIFNFIVLETPVKILKLFVSHVDPQLFIWVLISVGTPIIGFPVLQEIPKWSHQRT